MSNEYNYTTRKELVAKYKEKNKFKSILFGKENQKLFDALINNVRTDGYQAEVEKQMRELGMPHGDYLKKHFAKLVDFCVPEELRQGFYDILNKCNQFQYAAGWQRRTVRTKKYEPSVGKAMSLLRDYYFMGMYQCTLPQYLLNDLSEELQDLKRNVTYDARLTCLDLRIAAGIDSNEKGVKETIEDILLGENNTAMITTDIIRGIIKSSDEQLHKLLGDFLLAARLQEGVRQAVCENMDCGVEAAFLTLFDVIYENDLIRYSAVRRAVTTWIGLGDGVNEDRIMKKMMETMHKCLHDKKEVERCLAGSDMMELLIAMWTIGSKEVEDVILVLSDFLEKGNRQQIFAASYYNHCLQYQGFTGELSRKAIEKNPEDEEVIAAFFDDYLPNSYDLLYDACGRGYGTGPKKDTYKKIDVEDLLPDRSSAQKHYDILKNLIENMKKKEKSFSIFTLPGSAFVYTVNFTKSQLAEKMCILAYAMEDSNKIDYVIQYLPNIENRRQAYLELLLHDPQTEKQRNALVQAIADKETMTRKQAAELVKEMELTEEEHDALTEMLRFKKTDIRSQVISLLLNTEQKEQIRIIKKTLGDSKEDVRLGGLDMLMQAGKKDEEVLTACKPCLQDIKQPSSREQILIEQLEGGNAEESESRQNLYEENESINFEKGTVEAGDYPLFTYTKQQLNTLFQQLDTFIETHKEDTYKDAEGVECILGNSKTGLLQTSYDYKLPLAEKMPLVPLWKEFYEKEIKDYATLYAMSAALRPGGILADLKEREKCIENYKKLLGKDIYNFDASGFTYGPVNLGNQRSLFHSIINVLMEIYSDQEYIMAMGEKVCKYLAVSLPEDACWFERVEDKHALWRNKTAYCFADYQVISTMLGYYITSWKDEEGFKKRFQLLYQVDEKFDFENNEINTYRATGKTKLNAFDYVKACHLGMLTESQMYYALFEKLNLRGVMQTLGYIYDEKRYANTVNILKRYGLEEGDGFEESFHNLVADVYAKMADQILDVECKRGDTPTIYSSVITSINKVYGTKRLVELMKGMGNENFDRGSYYYGNKKETKSVCLSHLIQVSHPLKGENADSLKALLKGSDIKKKRLVEVAMYAPQWIDILEEYLKLPGLKSGCYYFIAHMNERFDDKKEAMIAKYTPLSTEELNQGAFDLAWFKEAYDTLGEDNFKLLYNSAKYISDGNKHSRARKYADAALNLVDLAEMKAVIIEKRNKDLLMSYGLVPLKGKKDMLERYEFIQRFLKESKKFGAQRRASEKLASEMALRNLASGAGYRDVTRLTLAMEMELIHTIGHFLEWNALDENVQVKLVIDEKGKSEILVEKKGKKLSSIPAAFKKNEYVLEMKEVHKKLKEQYSRTVKMFELAMEEREIYSFGELEALRNNPVTAPIVNNIIFVEEREGQNPKNRICGLITTEGLVSPDGTLVPCKNEQSLRVAHPYDLYEMEVWSDYQKLYFLKQKEENKSQPFRQVFRELYVKLEEEQMQKQSRMFAGNQIQPQKTKACLKGRRWVADYEEGLQKVYYKDNIVAQMYALADWFSPSDIEAPTLEYVVFFHRKDFRRLTMEEVPAIIYSEVMRDVDLAVSVAHAGSVNPETSHSTIEMRGVIAQCNVEMFGLGNVRIEGNHALIKGTLGDFSVHLGSGVIHKMGGHQIQVLPVHSQRRGRIFLPFLDEDPKTAEIISKILLFAEDKKIKDPYILQQI
ncbi:DUF4132 domain-containing protein [Lachnospiraceae bacterium OttesenSCG-928-D06]|nr:DUF4132 domain-containing protein [Lachnospiraceae bacterium OttesenSCG-928-D06]